jgi:hypothetical protein
MTIRPPRPARRPRDQRPVRDWTIAILASLALVIMFLRLLLAAFDVGTWTVAWRVVELPTQPFITLLEQLQVLRHTPIGRVTIAELIFAIVVGVVALTTLSSTALRRPD